MTIAATAAAPKRPTHRVLESAIIAPIYYPPASLRGVACAHHGATISIVGLKNQGDKLRGRHVLKWEVEHDA
jgi:hypothetical protein